MLRELVVHIGPPKTATTLIQEACKRSRSNLAEQGLSYEVTDGLSAHHVLSSYLLGLDATSAHVGWHNMDRGESRFPQQAAGERQLISSENLYRLGAHGVEALMDWAEPDRVTVVAALREPVRWLWSWWQQTCKWPVWEPWPTFVSRLFETREFFPKTYLAPWADTGVPTRVILLDLSSGVADNPAQLFVKSLGVELSPDALDFSAHNRVNDSMTVGETLMTALLVREVVRNLTERERGVWGEVTPGLVGRVCLDLVDRAHPMFEVGRCLELTGLENGLSPLDQSTLPAVHAYREAWWGDLQDLMDTTDLDVELTPTATPPIRESVPDWNGFDLPMGIGFPKSDFEEFLETPPELYAMARLLTASIGKLNRVTRSNPESPKKCCDASHER